MREPYLPPGSSFQQAESVGNSMRTRKDAYNFCRVARILRIDHERMICDVAFLDIPGKATEVEIAHGAWGPRSFVGAMPEENSLAVVAWFNETPTIAKPRVIGFMGAGYRAALNWDPTFRGIGKGPSFRDPLRKRFVKLLPGDVLMQAAPGAYGKLTDSVFFQAASGEVFLLRSSDHHALLRTLNLTQATGAGRIIHGPILRNPAIAAAIGESAEDQEFARAIPVLAPDGRRLYYITQASTTRDLLPFVRDGAQPYTESREVLREFSDLVLDVFEALDKQEGDPFSIDPNLRNTRFAEIVRGTFVGDNYDGPEANLYGRTVRLKIFEDSFRSDEANPPEYVELSALEEGRLAIAEHYRLFKPTNPLLLPAPDSGSQFSYIRDIDKFGVLYEVVPASTIETPERHPLASGLSAVRLYEGGIKEHYGATTLHVNDKPQELDAIAGDNPTDIESGISTFRTYDGALHFKVKGPDSANDAWVLEIVEGNAKIRVAGDVELFTGGNLQEWVEGDIERVFKGNVYERVEGNFKKEIKGDEFRHTDSNLTRGVAGDEIRHVVGGQGILIGNGRNEKIGQPAPIGEFPTLPTQLGISVDKEGNRRREITGTDPNPGVGTGITAPGDSDSETEFFGDVTRSYYQDLEEQVLGSTSRSYIGTVDEAFASAVTRDYLQTVEERVAISYKMTATLWEITAATAANITGAGPVTLRSSTAVIEAAPTVLRG